MGKTIGIIGAMDSEVQRLKEFISVDETVTISGIDYVCGQFEGKKVIIAKSGVGKVFAGICAQTMIITFKPDMLINVGVAGSLSKDLDIADVAIANNVVQYDMDTTAVGDPLGMISGINIIYLPCDQSIVDTLSECANELRIKSKVGTIASGDSFVNSREKKKYIVDNFSAISCEMEGAAIGQVCYVNKVPFCVIRAISDNGDENSENDYFVSMTKASGVAMDLTEKYLQKL